VGCVVGCVGCVVGCIVQLFLDQTKEYVEGERDPKKTQLTELKGCASARDLEV
jgi:hypothetical protein